MKTLTAIVNLAHLDLGEVQIHDLETELGRALRPALKDIHDQITKQRVERPRGKRGTFFPKVKIEFMYDDPTAPVVTPGCFLVATLEVED